MSIETHLSISIVNPRFRSGQYVITAGIHDLVVQGRVNLGLLLGRHLSGDWGDLDDSDKRANDRAVSSGEDRIFSSYQLANDLKVYVITEWDRSVTTVLLPEEY